MTNRRSFLKGVTGAGALSFLGSAGALSVLGNSPAFAADVSGYKALVCVFFFGGQDCHDTVLPFDQASYDRYGELRTGILAEYAQNPGGSSRDRDRLLELTPTNAAQFGTQQFALPEELVELKTLFDTGNAAIVGNVGPLIQPLTAQQFQADVLPQPKRLFSHNDQQSTWMSSAPEGQVLGWGGRFSDTVIDAGANTEDFFTAITTAGNTVFLAGEKTTQYNLNTNGPPEVDGLKNFNSALLGPAADSELAVKLLEDHYRSIGLTRTNLFERDLATIADRAFSLNEQFNTALDNAQALSTPFPGTGLGNQLRAIANTINIKSALGVGRQVFFAGIGGFDSHNSQATDLPNRQRQYSQAISAFFQATLEMGAENDVTLFTASDFGRALIENGNGTDHGWGSHHFVVGGAVNGNTVYGNIPPYDIGHPQDAGNGRLVPVVSVEQYAATMGKWFGLSDPELLTALPALSNFITRDLGFMNGSSS
ncbi:MAG: DUF1501 domain-containing protein [Robiginitomaculum sp.]|nr:DUF1501 domain-containing protein [Robiginitomaculum sp.]